jgi:NADP-dependent 3-hydroxy acid dehydrogenase YdfG
MSKLMNQVAVITGGGTGMGRAIALALAEEGAILILIGRRLEPLEDVADAVRHKAPRTICCPADLTNDDDMIEAAQMLRQEFQQIDILVHSAGINKLGTTATASLADLDNHYRTNARAPYMLTQALLPLLKSGRGQVVFINSSAGITARGNVGQYASSKHALKAIADSLRDEVNEDGIRVLSVYPGRTASEHQAVVCAMEGREYRPERFIQPEDIASIVLNALCLPRTAEITDVHVRPMMKTY